MQFPRSKATDSTSETAKYLQLPIRCKQQHFYLPEVKENAFTNHKMAL